MILERGYLRQTFRMVCFVHFVFSLCVFLMCFVCVHYFLLRFLLQQTTFDVIYIYSCNCSTQVFLSCICLNLIYNI